MTDEEKIIEIPEICRVEGHSAVKVNIQDNQVVDVALDVFEGTRFFEQLVIDHHYEEIPHITSRVCAICSTGHVIAAAFAIENILNIQVSEQTHLLRELMHLGMIIESHATHIYALALPDFIGAVDLLDFASNHEKEFTAWTQLRKLGAAIQTTIGGRPFHPINLHVGGLSSIPTSESLSQLLIELKQNEANAFNTCELLGGFTPKTKASATPNYLALIPEASGYGFFGSTIISSAGWQDSIQNYQQYLTEVSIPYSHAKRSTSKGQPIMVGAMSRLYHFGKRLTSAAKQFYESSALSKGDTNTVWNNLAQAIEIVEAIERSKQIIEKLLAKPGELDSDCHIRRAEGKAGKAVGAVECPRGTLYHYYEIDESGKIQKADMVTPSAQNSHRIEADIREVVNSSISGNEANIQSNLETLVRAYDPCNTCATHMVSVHYKQV